MYSVVAICIRARMANCRVWMGNLAPGLPRARLAAELASFSIAPRDFALFHNNFARASSAILAYDTQLEVDESILVLNGAESSLAITGKALIARRAEDTGDREHPVIRLRKAPNVPPPRDEHRAHPPLRRPKCPCFRLVIGGPLCPLSP